MGRRGRTATEVAEGVYKLFPVEKLLRRAKGLRTRADEAAAAARRGTSPPTRPRNRNQAKNWRAARAERDRLHDEAVRKKAEMNQLKDRLDDPNTPQAERDEIVRRLSSDEFAGYGRAKTVTAATDPETGITRGGYNGRPDSDGWGCAEKNAVEAINEERAAMTPPRRPLRPDEVDFCEALEIGDDVGDRVVKPIDGACQRRTEPEQFPNNVPYYPNDPSSRGNGWDHRRGIP